MDFWVVKKKLGDGRRGTTLVCAGFSASPKGELCVLWSRLFGCTDIILFIILFTLFLIFIFFIEGGEEGTEEEEKKEREVMSTIKKMQR